VCVAQLDRAATGMNQFPRDVTDHLQLLLRKSGHHLHTTAEREVVRIIKEKCCYVALNPSKEEKDTLGRPEEFRLPDGNVVQVSSDTMFDDLSLKMLQLGSERFRAPEILFNPELIGQEYAGVHQVVVDSINRVDLDLRKSLFSNIVLSGGSTLCKGKLSMVTKLDVASRCVLSIVGFGDRLLNEVKKLALKDVKIKIYAPPERKYSTWIGGSILAGLGTFKKVWRLHSGLEHGAHVLFTDVGLGRGIPRRSRYHTQEIGLLSCYRLPSAPSFSHDTHHIQQML
jgi:centractin